MRGNKKELNELIINKVAELLNNEMATDVKIQVNVNRAEVPTIRYDITEHITAD